MLHWIVDEWSGDSVYAISHPTEPLLLLSTYGCREALWEEVKRRGFEIIEEKAPWADDEDDEEDCDTVLTVNGFEELDFLF